MGIRIEALTEKYKDQLYEYECENREYFKSIGLGRSDEYYIKTEFDKIFYNCIRNYANGVDYMFLVLWDEIIVGRINITDVLRGTIQKGEVGYRVGEKFQKKGYATLALKGLVTLARNELKLHRLEAGTAVDNLSSQRVLEKNGFRKVGMYEKYICIEGKWIDSLIYELVVR